MDCTSCLSETGLKVVALLMDFHTPPLAEPTNTVTLPSSSTASIAAMRPLMVAEPMLRAGNPEMVPESNFAGRASCALAAERNAAISRKLQVVRICSLGRREQAVFIFRDPLIYLLWNILARTYFDAGFDSNAAGSLKSLLSMATLASILCTVTFPPASGLSLGPVTTENGNITPLTGLYEPSRVTVSRTAPRTTLCFSIWISM